MVYAHNPNLDGVAEAAIAVARSWVAGRDFPADKPLLDLSQAVPSYPPAESLRAHLAERVMAADTAVYTAIAGMPDLRAALARHLSDHYRGAVAAEQCFVTAGCNQAFCLALMALAGPGDDVILPAPWYFNHRMWLDMTGVTTVPLPFRPDRHGVPDPADAEPLITPRTRALVLVTPNNPTGAVFPPAAIEAFYDLAKAHGIALVLDETYKDFIDSDAPPHGLFVRPDWHETLIHLFSFSKSYALAGYRVGSLTAGADTIAAVTKVMDTVSICTSRIAQDAALYGLEHLADWRDEKRAQMAERVDALNAAVRGDNRLGYRLIASGAYFAYLEHPFADETDWRVARRLAADHNLLCLPGTMFGPGQDRYLRLAFANVDADRMPEIVERLAASQNRGAVS